MSDVGKAVRYKLAATSEVTAICKNNIYADALEQGISPPAVIVEVPSANATEDLNDTNRFIASQVVVTAFGRTRDEANLLAKQIRDYALPANLRGSIEGVDFKEVSLTGGPAEMAAEPLAGSNKWLRMTRQTFTIWA